MGKAKIGRALAIVRKYAPDVNTVRDGADDVEVEITRSDVTKARRADHGGCAVAVAGTRATQADGMIVSINTAYVIKGKTAFRYKLPPSVSREITAFDRGADFAPGTYRLVPPSESIALGSPRHERGGHSRESSGKRTPAKHLTEDIRAVLIGDRKRRSR